MNVSCTSAHFDVEGAGLPFGCRGDKYNCSIMDPLEVWVWRVLSRQAGGQIHQEPLI